MRISGRGRGSSSNNDNNGGSNERGFTLVEISIVLVIIGIIIGAVMKGQDLIDNARSKKLASVANSWQVLVYDYLDRAGTLPGANSASGLIDGNVAGALQAMSFTSAPPHSFNLGSILMYVYLGNDGGNNYIVLCPSVSCATKISNTSSTGLSSLKFFQSFDTAVDGSANPTLSAGGLVYGMSAAPNVSAESNWSATGITVATSGTDWLSNGNLYGALMLLK
ncbi:MAG: prepilin-type N-terminal cleavage/methylation domain-containing protein [Nitrospirae bacterium]|nr:prepilin-type N-terminal cleavage/methylation domain-containing protein [Nitrospirota bacterium]